MSDKTALLIEDAIKNTQSSIKSNRTQARLVLFFILLVVIFFLLRVGAPFIRTYLLMGKVTPTVSMYDPSNNHIRQLENIPQATVLQYDSLVSKGIAYQQLLNQKTGFELEMQKQLLHERPADVSDYLLYTLFVVLFGVFTSLYRYFLREMARHQHYLMGFDRLRIALSMQAPRYHSLIMEALVHHAFYAHDVRDKPAVNSPLPGHPLSDFSAQLLSRIADKIDFTFQKEHNTSKKSGGEN